MYTSPKILLKSNIYIKYGVSGKYELELSNAVMLHKDIVLIKCIIQPKSWLSGLYLHIFTNIKYYIYVGSENNHHRDIESIFTEI